MTGLVAESPTTINFAPLDFLSTSSSTSPSRQLEEKDIQQLYDLLSSTFPPEPFQAKESPKALPKANETAPSPTQMLVDSPTLLTTSITRAADALDSQGNTKTPELELVEAVASEGVVTHDKADRTDSQTAIPPPALGQHYASRDAFKNACQSYAVAFSAAYPAQAFRFSTRTSAVDKFLVFSCHMHTTGCPFTCRAEKDKASNDWIITSHIYEHRHGPGAIAQKALEPAKIKEMKPARKFTIIKAKTPKSSAFTDSDFEGYKPTSFRPRSGSVSSINSQTGRLKARPGEGKIRSAFVKHMKKKEYARLNLGISSLANSPQPSPRHKSQRERGGSYQHQYSSMRSLDEVAGNMDISRATSPAFSEEDSDASTAMMASLIRSNSFSGPNYTYQPAPSAEPRRSSFSAPGDVTRASLEGFLVNLHPLLSGIIEPLREAGIPDVTTLLSLEQPELAGVVDALPDSKVSSLQKMLIKNRVGRTLPA